MGQKQPAAAKDPLQLKLIDLRVGIDPWGDATVLRVDQLVDIGFHFDGHFFILWGKRY